MRALNPVETNVQCMDRKLVEKSKDLSLEVVKLQVNLNDIKTFENHNSSIAVNVFG